MAQDIGDPAKIATWPVWIPYWTKPVPAEYRVLEYRLENPETGETNYYVTHADLLFDCEADPVLKIWLATAIVEIEKRLYRLRLSATAAAVGTMCGLHPDPEEDARRQAEREKSLKRAYQEFKDYLEY